MHEAPDHPRNLSRITCQVHHRLSHRITQSLFEMEMDTVLVESGRTVRELRKKRPFKLPGTIVRIDDAPAELFRITVPAEHEQDVMQAMIAAAELDTPGRGSIFSQRVTEYSTCPIHAAPERASAHADRPLLHDLTLITCILSMHGSGEQVARLALELGTISVPADLTSAVLNALFEAGAVSSDGINRIQVLEAPAAFAHAPRRKS